jgi:hypothetical protein
MSDTELSLALASTALSMALEPNDTQVAPPSGSPTVSSGATKGGKSNIYDMASNLLERVKNNGGNINEAIKEVRKDALNKLGPK